MSKLHEKEHSDLIRKLLAPWGAKSRDCPRIDITQLIANHLVCLSVPYLSVIKSVVFGLRCL